MTRQYPEGFNLKGRSIVAAGTATLSADFGLPSPSLAGKKAIIYVPADDKEYDRVFVGVGNQTYEDLFAGTCWCIEIKSRLPHVLESVQP